MSNRKIIHTLFIGATVTLVACSFDKSGITPIDSGVPDAIPTDAIPSDASMECIGQAQGTPCGDQSTTECSAPDTCDGAGACVSNDVAALMPCGDSTDTECNGADTCDGAGTCVDNLKMLGDACGDPTDNDCNGADTCDGADTCLDNVVEIGIACGSPDTTDCSSPDTCDGSGTCLGNHQPEMQSCDDCAAGIGFCDACAAGVCEDIACADNACLVDFDCTPAMTSGTCVDMADDCATTACIGATPPIVIDAGAPAGTDFTSWQENYDSDINNNLFYCNATQPVATAGVLTDWSLYVANFGSNGENAQLVVIRCGAGGGGAGPELSNCRRVGLGPMQDIGGNGLESFTLAGSTQADGAATDPDGIVVEPGDVLCASTNRYAILIDCNASATPGGCPGPDFNTQYRSNVDVVPEPFALINSSRNGTLAISATGMTYEVQGTCSDTAAEPDLTTCADNGDTCCAGVCEDTAGGGTCP